MALLHFAMAKETDYVEKSEKWCIGGGTLTYTEGTISGSSTTMTCKKGDIIVMNWARSSQVQILWNGVTFDTTTAGYIYSTAYSTNIIVIEIIAQQETNTIALNGGTFSNGHYLIISNS